MGGPCAAASFEFMEVKNAVKPMWLSLAAWQEDWVVAPGTCIFTSEQMRSQAATLVEAGLRDANGLFLLVLPEVRILRDLRHIVANITKIPCSISHGSHYAKYLAGCVTFSSALATASLLLASYFVRFPLGRSWQDGPVPADGSSPVDEEQSVDEVRVERHDGMPGFGPNTVFQGVERFNGTL
eukprot:s444_g5.t1